MRPLTLAGAPTTRARPREHRSLDDRAAGRARRHHGDAARGVARAAASPATDRAPRRPRRARRRGPPARALPLLRAALSRASRGRRALGMVALAAGAATGA